jgi:dimethylargininase
MIAITRDVSPSIAHCELTHLVRDPVRYEVARDQHREYEKRLTELGCRITRLPASQEFPDSVFIEDTAIVLDELAIITRPGAPSRRGETIAVAEVLAPHRPLVHIEEPGTVDGGDVMQVGRTLYVGVSSRTNRDGVAQLERIAESCGQTVRPLQVTSCLHLKSAVTYLGDDTLLLNPHWIDRGLFTGLRIIETHADEPGAANAIRIGERVLYASSYPRTQERMQQHGFRVVATDASELAKAEGALTCCSLLFPDHSTPVSHPR